MPTTLTLTAQPGTASVLLEVAGAPSPGAAVYTGTFEASVEGWAPVAAGTVSRLAGAARTGGFGLRQSSPSTGAARTVTGLTVGASYRVTGWVRKAFSATQAPTVGVTGKGSTASTAGTGVWAQVVHDFTATATSHELVVTAAGGDLDDVTVTVLPDGLTPATITRTDANGTGPVRLLEGQQPNAGVLVAVDYEPALAGPITYTLVDGLGVVVTAATTLDGAVTRPWLGVPVMPQLGAQVDDVLDDYAASQDWRGTLHAVIGRDDPVPTLASLSARTGSLSILASSHAQARAIAGVYSRGQVVQLRYPGVDQVDMHHVGTRVRVTRDEPRWRVAVDYTEVARPAGPLLGGLGWDFAALTGAYPDFAAVTTAFEDFAALTVGPL